MKYASVGAGLCARAVRAGAGSGPYAVMISFVFLSGCATTGTLPAAPPESMRTQIEAAQKVVGALSPDKGPAGKYSPLTGKHYSGALEYEPGTGVKLVPLEE